MKLNKKKIITLIFSVFCFSVFTPIVKADETDVCTQKVHETWIAGSKYITIPSLGRYSQMIHIYVGGNQAFCMDPGNHLPGTAQMQGAGCPASAIPASVKKALNYCDSIGGCSEKKYLYAQIYAWKGSGSKFAMAEASCSYDGESPYGLCPARRATDDTELLEVYNALNSASTDGFFTCWKPLVSGYQRVATKGESECKQYCPENSDHPGREITPEEITTYGSYEKAVEALCGTEKKCYGHNISQTGSLNPCKDNNSTTFSSFKEVIEGISKDATGSEHGRLKEKIGSSGKYCALYCLETNANAVLPGGLANPITLGSTITWPTSDKTNGSRFGNMFPISFSGEMKCRFKVAGNGTKPYLTYGNTCDTDPVVTYNGYRTDLETAYNNGNTAAKKADVKSAAEEANNWTDTSKNNGGGVTAIATITNTDKLLLNNEEIRVNHSTAVVTSEGIIDNPSEKLTTDSADSNYFIGNYQFYKKGLDGKNTAEANYNSQKNYCISSGNCKETTSKYHAPEYEDDGTTVKTAAYCDDNFSVSGTKCTCTSDECVQANDDNVKYWADAKAAWNAYYNAINAKYSSYKTYMAKYRLTVELYNEIRTCATYTITCSGTQCDVYNFTTNVKFQYEDEGEYGGVVSLIKEDSANYSCTECDGKEATEDRMKFTTRLMNSTGYNYIKNNATGTYLKGRIDATLDRKVEITTTKETYALVSNWYNYLNKNTNKWVQSKPTTDNYITYGLAKDGTFLFSNLPTSYNNKVNKQYKLELYDISLGDVVDETSGLGQFNEETVNFNPYVCHYQVKTDNDECICPPGTKHSGIDLYQAILDSEVPLTCADAKEKYCDGDSVPKCEENCVEDKYCTNDKTIKITACVNSGKKVADCEALLCQKKYKCDSGTKLAGMDMTSCVQTRMVQGQTEANAIKYCNKTVCSLQNFAIYRTIDLQNPFPGKNWGISNGPIDSLNKVFNLDGGGRYPGYNWNGATVVKKLIHTTRDSVVDYDIYNQTPLYHFELDTATILNIREYNSNQKLTGGYNDFTLDCIKDLSDPRLGTVCLSKYFVHDARYGGDTSGSKSLCGGANTTTRLEDCLVAAGKLKEEE